MMGFDAICYEIYWICTQAVITGKFLWKCLLKILDYCYIL